MCSTNNNTITITTTTATTTNCYPFDSIEVYPLLMPILIDLLCDICSLIVNLNDWPTFWGRLLNFKAIATVTSQTGSCGLRNPEIK